MKKIIPFMLILLSQGTALANPLVRRPLGIPLGISMQPPVQQKEAMPVNSGGLLQSMLSDWRVVAAGVTALSALSGLAYYYFKRRTANVPVPEQGLNNDQDDKKEDDNGGKGGRGDEDSHVVLNVPRRNSSQSESSDLSGPEGSDQDVVSSEDTGFANMTESDESTSESEKRRLVPTTFRKPNVAHHPNEFDNKKEDEEGVGAIPDDEDQDEKNPEEQQVIDRLNALLRNCHSAVLGLLNPDKINEQRQAIEAKIAKEQRENTGVVDYQVIRDKVNVRRFHDWIQEANVIIEYFDNSNQSDLDSYAREQYKHYFKFVKNSVGQSRLAQKLKLDTSAASQFLMGTIFSYYGWSKDRLLEITHFASEPSNLKNPITVIGLMLAMENGRKEKRIYEKNPLLGGPMLLLLALRFTYGLDVWSKTQVSFKLEDLKRKRDECKLALKVLEDVLNVPQRDRSQSAPRNPSGSKSQQGVIFDKDSDALPGADQVPGANNVDKTDPSVEEERSKRRKSETDVDTTQEADFDFPIEPYPNETFEASRPISPINEGLFGTQAQYVVQFLHSTLSNVRFVHELLKFLEQDAQTINRQERLLCLTEAACSINEAQSMLSALASYMIGLNSFGEFKRGFSRNFKRAHGGQEKDARAIIAELRGYFPEQLTNPVELPHLLALRYQETEAKLEKSSRNTPSRASLEQKQKILRQLSNDTADVFSAITFARFVDALERDNPEDAWQKSGNQQAEIINLRDTMRCVIDCLKKHFSHERLSGASSVDKVLLASLDRNPVSIEQSDNSHLRVSPESRESEGCLLFQFILDQEGDNAEQLPLRLLDCYTPLSQLVAGLKMAMEALVLDGEREIVNQALNEPLHKFINRHVTIDLFLEGMQPHMEVTAFLPKAILEKQTRVLRRDLVRILMLQKMTSQRGVWGVMDYFFGGRATEKDKKKYADLRNAMQRHNQFWAEWQGNSRSTGILERGQQKSPTLRLQQAVCDLTSDKRLINTRRQSLIRSLEVVNKAMPNSLDESKSPQISVSEYFEHIIWQLKGNFGT